MKKIGVLNSGGDCAGLNAVIAAIVKTGYHEYEFVGFNKGLDGLLDDGTEIDLTRERVRGISHLGGTILTTVNKGRMNAKIEGGKVVGLDPDVVKEAKAKFDKLGLEGLIVIGGDGTLSSAYQLSKAGIPIVGVPKTIDNDIRATEKTFGFDSAIEVVIEALDRIHTTATSHNRIMIVEVMGRNAGWIALHAGLAGGADVILIPEIKFSYHKVAEVLKQRQEKGSNEAVVVVAEGAMPSEESGPIYKQHSASGEHKLGGIAERLSKFLTAEIPNFENRYVVLGHVQRGGSPTADDRILGFMYGAHALEQVRQNNYGVLVTWDGSKLGTVPLSEVVSGTGIKEVDPQGDLVKMARQAEISFGD